jgi:hypothetical protein
MAPSAQLFSTVPNQDYMSLLQDGNPKREAVMNFFHFGKKEMASATGIPAGSVRYDTRMPDAVKQKLTEWASLVNLVAQFFGGDVHKTELWFRLPNPLLGNVSPRDMIRYGRYETMRDFIYTSLSENRQ